MFTEAYQGHLTESYIILVPFVTIYSQSFNTNPINFQTNCLRKIQYGLLLCRYDHMLRKSLFCCFTLLTEKEKRRNIGFFSLFFFFLLFISALNILALALNVHCQEVQCDEKVFTVFKDLLFTLGESSNLYRPMSQGCLRMY